MKGLPNTTYVPTKATTTGGANEAIIVQLGAASNVAVDSIFATADDGDPWTTGTGWAIAGGKATHTAGNTASLFQANILVVDDYYLVAYQILDFSAGSVKVAGGATLGESGAADGFYAEILQATLSASFGFVPVSAFAGAIDNAYAYPLNENTGAIDTYNVIERIDWSYSATPTGGGLQIADSTGVIYDLDIATAGPGHVEFIDEDGDLTGGFYGTARKPLAIILKPGGGSVEGALNVTSR